ncbi:MAG: hypothetical protein ACLFVS_07465, partial [Candidatus Acetothermia bacterium]
LKKTGQIMIHFTEHIKYPSAEAGDVFRSTIIREKGRKRLTKTCAYLDISYILMEVGKLVNFTE